MNYINFFRMSFYLFLNASILNSSEAEEAIRGWLNPLTQQETYIKDGKFTLDKAEKAIEESEKDLVNSASEGSISNPLKWLCARACEFAPLTEKNRRKLATFFLENGANDESIKQAHLFCQTNHNSYN